MLVAIVGKEQNGTPWGVNLSCTCTHYTMYANYAINALYVQYVPELTLATALVTAVGAVTLMTQILCQLTNTLPVEREMPVWDTVSDAARLQVTSRSFAQCHTSLGVPIICLAYWSTRSRRAARPLGVLCHSNTSEAGPRSPCAHEAPIEYWWPSPTDRYSKSDLEARRYGDLHRDNLNYPMIRITVIHRIKRTSSSESIKPSAKTNIRWDALSIWKCTICKICNIYTYAKYVIVHIYRP